MAPAIPDELRRFPLTGTLSVPEVEAVLQRRQTATARWDAERLARRIHVAAARVRDLLANLHASTAVGDQNSARFVLRLFQYLLIPAAITRRNFSRRQMVRPGPYPIRNMALE